MNSAEGGEARISQPIKTWKKTRIFAYNGSAEVTDCLTQHMLTKPFAWAMAPHPF
jgi:hypothetical protein